MRKLNILIACDSVGYQMGGAFISPMRFAELLKKRGHKVVFIAAKHSGGQEVDYYKGIKVYRFRSFSLPKFPLIRIAFPTKKEVEKIIKKEKIDIVHVMVPTPVSVSSINSAKKNSIKIVSHSHTQPENILLQCPSFMRTEFLRNWIYKRLISFYGKTELTFCPSKFAERALKKYNPNLKTIVVSNGIDLLKFKKMSSSKFTKKFNIPRGFSLILYAGRLDPEKRIDVLIQSMKHVLKKRKKVYLILVGGGSMKISLENLSKSLELEKNIQFLGRVSDKDLSLAYNASDVFVLPSLAELEGMVVLEAMACGKPILIANSKESASVDFVQQNGFLFKSGDSVDLSKKILKLLENDVLRKKMGKKSLELSKTYDINNSVNKLEKTYYSLLK